MPSTVHQVNNYENRCQTPTRACHDPRAYLSRSLPFKQVWDEDEPLGERTVDVYVQRLCTNLGDTIYSDLQ